MRIDLCALYHNHGKQSKSTFLLFMSVKLDVVLHPSSSVKVLLFVPHAIS